MKNKIFAMGFVVMLTLLLTGCLGESGKSDDVVKLQPPNPGLTKIEKENKEKRENLMEKYAEIEKRASEAGNASICDNIEDENKKYTCKYNIIADFAMEKGDPSLCDQIGHEAFVAECKGGIEVEKKE